MSGGQEREPHVYFRRTPGPRPVAQDVCRATSRQSWSEPQRLPSGAPGPGPAAGRGEKEGAGSPTGGSLHCVPQNSTYAPAPGQSPWACKGQKLWLGSSLGCAGPVLAPGAAGLAWRLPREEGLLGGCGWGLNPAKPGSCQHLASSVTVAVDLGLNRVELYFCISDHKGPNEPSHWPGSSVPESHALKTHREGKMSHQPRSR